MPKWPHLEVAKVGIFQMMFDHPSSPKKNKAKSCNVYIMNLHLGPTINHKILAWLQLLSWHPSFFTLTISLPFSSTRLNMMESIFIFIFNINSKYSWVYVRSSSNLVNWLSFKWGASWDTTCSASSSFTRSFISIASSFDTVLDIREESPLFASRGRSMSSSILTLIFSSQIPSSSRTEVGESTEASSFTSLPGSIF